MIRFTVLSSGFAGRNHQAGLQAICDRSSPCAVRFCFERRIVHIPVAARRRGPGRRVPQALAWMWNGEPLVQDGPEHADPVTECGQVADAINPGALKTGNLRDG